MNDSKGINAKDAVEGIPVPDKAEGTDVCRFCYFTPDKCICDGPRPPETMLLIESIVTDFKAKFECDEHGDLYVEVSDTDGNRGMFLSTDQAYKLRDFLNEQFP